MLFYKREGLAFGFLDFSAIAAGQTMFGVGDAMELEWDVELFKFGGHQFGLFKRNVGVGRAMNQDRRGIVGGDILNGHVWEEFFGF